VAGYVAEVVSGTPFAELVQRTVFDPLGMTRSTFDPTIAMTYPVAQAHEAGDDGVLRVVHRFADNTAHYPAGFAFSTVEDMAKLAVLFSSEGRFGSRQVLSPETVRLMQRPQQRVFPPAFGPFAARDPHVGLSLAVETYKGVRRISHTGGITSFFSQFMIDPDTGTGVILLLNYFADPYATMLDVTRIIDEVFDRLLDLPPEEEPETVVPDRSAWPRFVGSYEGPNAGVVVVDLVDDELVVDFQGTKLRPEPRAPDFYTAGEGMEALGFGFVHRDGRPAEFLVVNGEPARRIASGGDEGAGAGR
jgi:CubicO group peptidase (beta-lactamase class C family)